MVQITQLTIEEMSNYDAEETNSTISVSDMLEDEEIDRGNGELLPEIQAAIAKGLREFESQYDVSKTPGLMLDLYAYLETALKSCGSPALMDPSFVPGRITKQKRKTKMSGYIAFTKEAWKKYHEEKKALKKADPNYKSDLTPQDLLSKFALQWKSLSTAQKKPYMDLADQINNPKTAAGEAAVLAAKKKITRKLGPLSGYQYFVTITKCPEDMQSTNQMKYKAQLWSAKTEEEKMAYKIQSEDTFWKEHPDLLVLKNQKEAEEALKAEERRLNIKNMKFNAPVIKLPNILKKPVTTVEATPSVQDQATVPPPVAASVTVPVVTAVTVKPAITLVPVLKTPEVVSDNKEKPNLLIKKPEIKLGNMQRPVMIKEAIAPTVTGEVSKQVVKPIVNVKPIVMVKPTIALKSN